MLKHWLQAEPYTLAMSSGFFSFFAHAGMLAALIESECPPQKVSGSSAGALVGACWASGQSVGDIKAELMTLQKQDFWDPGLGFGLLQGEKFRTKLAGFLGAGSFESCRVPLLLSAYDIFHNQTHVFRQGNLVDAVYASCAFPFLFQPIKINNRYYLDGGVKDRPALAGVKPGERVLYHHIKSRSPWRRKNSKALRVPRRDNMQVIALDDIPRVGPDQLQQGAGAFDAAYQGTMEQLNRL